jgi:hypothetical protein
MSAVAQRETSRKSACSKQVRACSTSFTKKVLLANLSF